MEVRRTRTDGERLLTLVLTNFGQMVTHGRRRNVYGRLIYARGAVEEAIDLEGPEFRTRIYADLGHEGIDVPHMNTAMLRKALGLMDISNEDACSFVAAVFQIPREAAELRIAREDAGYESREAFAIATGIKISTIIAFESGARSPTEAEYMALSQALYNKQDAVPATLIKRLMRNGKIADLTQDELSAEAVWLARELRNVVRALRWAKNETDNTEL